MSEEIKKLEQELQEAKAALDAFMARNQTVIDEYKRTVEMYNAAVSRVRATAKAMATETGKTTMTGSVVAKPHTHPVWDLDKVAEILPDKLFRQAVRIDYKLLPKGVGEKMLVGFEKEYPKLLEVKGTKVTRVDISGLDEIDLKGVESGG